MWISAPPEDLRSHFFHSSESKKVVFTRSASTWRSQAVFPLFSCVWKRSLSCGAKSEATSLQEPRLFLHSSASKDVTFVLSPPPHPPTLLSVLLRQRWPKAHGPETPGYPSWVLVHLYRWPPPQQPPDPPPPPFPPNSPWYSIHPLEQELELWHIATTAIDTGRLLFSFAIFHGLFDPDLNNTWKPWSCLTSALRRPTLTWITNRVKRTLLWFCGD